WSWWGFAKRLGILSLSLPPRRRPQDPAGRRPAVEVSGDPSPNHYRAWTSGDCSVAVVEIAAFGEESLVQVAGTTLHEMGHVLADVSVGHGAEWKRACERLGLRRAMARYVLAAMVPKVRAKRVRLIAALVDAGRHSWQ